VRRADSERRFQKRCWTRAISWSPPRNTQGLEYLGTHDDILTVALDVTNELQVKAAVDAALKHFGRIDVLVNNAGYGLLGAVEESSADEVERLYRTNVFGLLSVTRAVLPSMRTQRAGHIVNISSIGGYGSYPGWGVYSSTKFAVEGITEALHGDLAPVGIHVSVIEPGFFRTDFLDSSSLAATKARIADYAGTVGKMRDFAAGRNHQQPGETGKHRRLSELQGSDPTIVVLSRGGFCPKDRRQAEGLVQLHREIEVGYCRLVTISTDNLSCCLPWDRSFRRSTTSPGISFRYPPGP
jgi:NAD(P)-dependent dehydrogenase (short-subunit alcohol dehydrogenase family)